MGALGAGARPDGMADQAVAVEQGVDGAHGRDFDPVWQSSQQALADLACSPMGFLAPGCDDCRFDLFRQLVGIAEGPARPIAEAFQTAFFIALKDLVAGFSGNPELAAQRGHALPVLEPDPKTHAFVHHRSFLPGHPTTAPSGEKSVTHVSGTLCYLCVGTVNAL